MVKRPALYEFAELDSMYAAGTAREDDILPYSGRSCYWNMIPFNQPSQCHITMVLSQNDHHARNDSKLGGESVKGAGREAPFAFKSRRSGKSCQKSFISGSFQGLSHASETAPIVVYVNSSARPLNSDSRGFFLAAAFWASSTALAAWSRLSRVPAPAMQPPGQAMPSSR